MLEAQPATEARSAAQIGDPLGAGALPGPEGEPPAGAARWRTVLPFAVVAVLTVVAAAVRLRALSAQFWVDEGIAVGIASHPLGDIPSLLRQDGSPPLYYALLHEWMAAFGHGERATHLLSVAFGVAGVPLTAWAAWPLGRRVALIAAGLAALNPLLSLYSDETRMYSLVFCLEVAATGAFLRALFFARHRWAVGFAVALALLLYTHAWGLFAYALFALVLAFAWWRERPRRREILLWGGGSLVAALVLFAPWIPVLLGQASSTAAPWSHAPRIREFGAAISALLGGTVTLTALVVAGALGAVVLWRAERRHTLLLAIGILGIGTLALGWGYSRFVSPAWADRYVLITLGPVLVALALALSRAGWAAVVALAVCAAAWIGQPPSDQLTHKSNVRSIEHKLRGDITAGTVVISTQPEQVPVLDYYFPRDVSYLTPLGRPGDVRIMDWRNASARLDRASFSRIVAPVIAAAPRGRRFLYLEPKIHPGDSSWARRLHDLGRRWRHALDRNPRLRRLRLVKTSHKRTRTDLTAVLYARR
jgi:hypothetical protein